MVIHYLLVGAPILALAGWGMAALVTTPATLAMWQPYLSRIIHDLIKPSLPNNQ